ncbi:MAG: hypothetical protein LIO93_08985 [Bacteroidales bacterium]|nr:hypothetical protein [Bacteroidales bacterium]
MNYIELINQFWQTRRIVSFSSKEADLYFVLLHECNIRNWQNPFECSNRSIVAAIGISEKTLIDVRNRLKQKGLIDFKSGKRKEHSPVYTLLYCKKVSLNDRSNVSKSVSKKVSKNVNPLKIQTETVALSSLSWKDDFSVYRNELQTAFSGLMADEEFIKEREKFHPGLDIPLSMEKAYVEYWSKESSWTKLRSSRYAALDWEKIFIMTLDQKQNHVWLKKGEKDAADGKEIVYV